MYYILFLFLFFIFIFYSVLCSTINNNAEPIVDTLEMNSLRSLRNHGGIDRALFSFDMDAGIVLYCMYCNEIKILILLLIINNFHPIE